MVNTTAAGIPCQKWSLTQMTIRSLMPAITTTAEILLEPITNFGASQLTQTRKHSNVLCPFAPLSKCFTFPLTMAGNLTSIIPSHLHLFRKKTFLLRSQYVSHLWWNSGELTKVLPYAFFLTAKKLFLLLDNKNKRWLYVELFAARKKMFARWTKKKPKFGFLLSSSSFD